jgi:hypothetical protein
MVQARASRPPSFVGPPKVQLHQPDVGSGSSRVLSELASPQGLRYARHVTNEQHQALTGHNSYQSLRGTGKSEHGFHMWPRGRLM